MKNLIDIIIITGNYFYHVTFDLLKITNNSQVQVPDSQKCETILLEKKTI